MKKSVLYRTNFIVCVVIVIGFAVTSFIGYQSNQGIFRKDVESVSKLTSGGIYHQIDSIFTKPINISLTMANDSLLKDFLEGEQQHLNDPEFIDTMKNYLKTYQEKYDYDSVFLASVQTRRYYYFNGLDRVLEEGDPENGWFYGFLERDVDYCIQIDNDQVDGAGNEVTIFINCRIKDEDGTVLGVVGVGFRVDFLQALLKNYENDFDVKASLIDSEGNVEISTEHTGFEGNCNLFESCVYPELKTSILTSKEMQNLWYSSRKGNGYVVSRYIENLDWYLVVENDTTTLNNRQTFQLFRESMIVVVTIFLVLMTITTVLKRYNTQIVELTIAKEKEHHAVFLEATEQMYENIYEIDISHNRAASEATAEYFQSLGAPSNVSYDKALNVIAQKQIKEEYRQGYVDTFAPENVMESFKKGIENLRYDFMITNDGKSYYWMRIMAHIFRWGEDDSIRMLVYRQNINEEKQHELYMMEQMQKDSLTGLYNKISSQEHVCKILGQKSEKLYAFFIFDIDFFKEINDHLGHAEGDEVLLEFARALQTQFCREDVVGRIGGDEFIAFFDVPNLEAVEERAGKLIDVLHRHVKTAAGEHDITVSIGIAVSKGQTDFDTLYRQADTALYQAKKLGRNGFVLYSQTE